MRKVRVLLNWDTTRKDLLEPFIALKDDIDFIIVWGEHNPDEKKNHPFEQIAFSDYKTPYQLLKAVRPDRILFFNINSFPQVALNLAARNNGIPTFIMHHGIHHSDFLEMIYQKEKRGLHKPRKPVSNVSTLFFYLSALHLRNLDQVIPFMRFAWLRQRRERAIAMEKCIFKSRLPDKYINLSPHNSIITRKIDHIKDDNKFIYIGHPFFDQILQRLNDLEKLERPAEDKFFLLVDFPNNDDVLQFKIMTAEKKRTFYKELSVLAKSFGCRLKIKLHPFGYDSPHNYQDDNIDLIREADIAALIHNAEKCFSFFSTLLIPIIYHRKSCFVFHIGHDRQLQKELVELGVAIKLETDNFSEKDISDNEINEVSEKAYQLFIERYLYYTDGNSVGRLKNVLIAG